MDAESPEGGRQDVGLSSLVHGRTIDDQRLPSTNLEGMDARKASLRGGLLFGYLFLATQEKVTRAKRESPCRRASGDASAACWRLMFVRKGEGRKAQIKGSGASPALQRQSAAECGSARTDKKQEHRGRTPLPTQTPSTRTPCNVNRAGFSEPAFLQGDGAVSASTKSSPRLTGTVTALRGQVLPIARPRANRQKARPEDSCRRLLRMAVPLKLPSIKGVPRDRRRPCNFTLRLICIPRVLFWR